MIEEFDLEELNRARAYLEESAIDNRFSCADDLYTYTLTAPYFVLMRLFDVCESLRVSPCDCLADLVNAKYDALRASETGGIFE